jgi:large subunit ribosomal protein L24
MNLSQKNASVVKAPADDKFLLGDLVIVISGSAKGQKGLLKKKIRTRTGLRYIVENCNMQTKHQKPNAQLNIAGGLKKIEGSIHSSNVAIFNPQTQKADKIRFAIEDGKKTRRYKSTGLEIEKRSSKKVEG